MSLTERIDAFYHDQAKHRIDRRETVIEPIVERRAPPKLPEWRRRAQADVARVGYVAVKDLSERAA